MWASPEYRFFSFLFELKATWSSETKVGGQRDQDAMGSQRSRPTLTWSRRSNPFCALSGLLYPRRVPTRYARPHRRAAAMFCAHSSDWALVQSTAASFGGGKGCGIPGIHGRRRGGRRRRLLWKRPHAATCSLPAPASTPRPAVAVSLPSRKRPPTLPSARLPSLTALSAPEGPLNCHFLARGGCVLGPGPPGGQHPPPQHPHDWRSFPESSVQRLRPISSAMGPGR